MWSDFESDVVEGRYPLEKLVRSEGRCGWFESKFDGKAVILSLTESLNDESELLERLRAAEKVKDRNVAAILKIGTTNLQDTPLVYAVMEYTEENLDDVLRARALTADETKEVAESMVKALQAIHKERLVCVRNGDGRIEPASVLASDDTVKLRSDHLYLIAANAAFAPYITKDLQGLGSLIYQCLTQRAPKQPVDANDASVQQLPRPFVQVVRRAWSGLATLDEIGALIRGSAVPAASPAPIPVPASTPTKTAQKPAAVPAPAAAKAVPPASSAPKAPEPVLEDAPQGASGDLFESTSKSFSRSTGWIIGGFVVLLLIVVFVLRSMLHSSAPPERKVVIAPPDAAPASGSAPAPAKPTVPSAMASVPAAASSPATGNWRVVAYTYNHQDQAAHKARTVNAKHPDLQAGVFSPKGSGAPYLVTLGSPMGRSEAFRLRDKAIREGLPSDTFARNY